MGSVASKNKISTLPSPQDAPKLERQPDPAEAEQDLEQKEGSDPSKVGPRVTHLAEMKYDGEGNLIGVNQLHFVEQIGKGATAAVYKATEIDGSRKLAVKVLNKHFLKSKRVGQFHSALDDARNEIELWKRLSHPNILPLLEVIDAKDAEHIFLVSEYIEGGPLMPVQAFEAAPIEEQHVRNLFRQLVDGLTYMHSQGVAHNDIKPENLIEEASTKRLLLADFGSAQDIVRAEAPENAESLRANTTLMFTPPEVLDQEPGDTYKLRPTDVWAVGITLFMLLFGRPPYEGETFFELSMNVLEGEISFPETIEVSESARDIIQAMLDHDPKQRITLDHIKEHAFYSKVEG